MTGVFLSYHREDKERAQSIAVALERAGHSIWWDAQIKGGAQYSKEIEEALGQAEAVVVLWSKLSIESAWVRDEAAAGRDTGRLVPVLIDATHPPLGFRQYQNIDLSAWRSGRRSAAFDRLSATLTGLGKADAASPAASASPPVPIVDKGRSRQLMLSLGAAILLAVALAAWAMAGSDRGIPTIAVAAAEPSPESRRLARELLVMLGRLQSVKSDTMRLVESSGEASVQADLIIEASASSRLPEANLVLLMAKDRTVLWSKDFKPPSGKPSDLKQQLAYTAARVLDCSLEALNPKAKRRLDDQTLSLYLNGCAQFAELIGTNTLEIIPLFAKVTKAASWFEPGWAKLLLSESLTTDLPGNTQDRVDPALVRKHIAQAREVNPQLVEASLAEISLLPSTALLQRAKLIDQSLKTEPENAVLLSSRSKLYGSVGRLDDAIRDAKRASQLEPLSPAFRHTYISVLSHSGQLEAAFQELESAEQLWPGASNMIDARFRLHIFYGSAHEALRLMRKGITNYHPSIAPVLTARIEPSAGNLARARDLVRQALRARPEASTGPVHGHGQFGIPDELFALLDPSIHTEPELFSILFRPPFQEFRRDKRFVALAAKFGLVKYWRTTGVWADFCREPELPYDCQKEAAKIAAKFARPRGPVQAGRGA